MKIYLSADIEGITGTTHWNETDQKNPDYAEFREQMTAEVAAACEGALNAGATEIWVKDAHDSGRNLIASRLPKEARLLRGWSGHPYMMMEGLDPTFQAALMIGYHSRAGSNASPLAHTMTTSNVYVKINDRFAAEFLVNAYTAALENVPVVFVSGDAGLGEDAAALIPSLTSVAVKSGLGNSTINIHPHLAMDRIRAGVQKALEDDLSRCRVQLPEHFSVEIMYKNHNKAYESSFFPGVHLIDANTIGFEAKHYFDVLRLLAFVI
jgi:D-amino peptidase